MEANEEEQREQVTMAEDLARNHDDKKTEKRGLSSSNGDANDKGQRTRETSDQEEHGNDGEEEVPRYGSESEAEAASVTGDDEQSQDEEKTQRDRQGEACEEISQASHAEEEEAKIDEAKTEIPTAEIWTALVSALKAHPKGTYLVEWKSTVQTLFKIEHERLPIRSHLVPQQKQRYPNLTEAEVTHLLELIAVAQEKEPMQYEDWQRRVAIICKKLYAEPRMLSDILVQTTSQLRWTPAPVLDKWSQVVKGSTEPTRGPQGHHRVEFKPFMFDPSVYAHEDIKRLESICLRRCEQGIQGQMREGTQDEWTIIKGMLEGHIACRELPPFVKQVLDEDTRLRLYGTVQAQVEGELTLRLGGRDKLQASQQSTKSIVEAILRAAEPGATQSLYNFINALKTVSYNRVTKEIHFYFFTRMTAATMASVPIPFRGRVYGLRNVHAKASRNAWENQRSSSRMTGVRTNMYEIRLHNVTRFVEVGKLKAYLRKHIPMEFSMETLDKCNPKAHLSSVWQLQFQLAGCPTFLDGIVRIQWFGHNLILQHPRTPLRLICLNCGGQGHRMVNCNEREEEKMATGTKTVTEADLTGLEDLAKPFMSMEDIRQSAETRLQRQQQKTRDEQKESETYKTNGVQDHEGAKHRPSESAGARIRIPPRRRPKVVIQASTAKKTTFSASGMEGEDAVDTEGPAEINKKENKDDSRDQFLGSEKETEDPAILMAELKRERDALEALGGHVKTEPSARLDFHKPSPKAPEPGTWKEVEQIAGIRLVETLRNGNCQATALAQALADDDLQAYPAHLAEMVATLKRGIRVMALTNLEKQFPHQARREALTEVGRGWPNMSKPNSLKLFRQYLDEYASTPSNAEATLAMVPRKNWGCSDTLLVAANLLHRDIYVLGKDAMGQKGWQCTRFTFGTRTKDKESYVKGLQYKLEIRGCLQLLVEEKQKAIDEEKPMPIVLKYVHEHYSAYVHHGIPLQNPQELSSQEMEIDETAEENEDGVQRSLVAEFISDEDSPSEEEYVAPDGSKDVARSLVPYEESKRSHAKREHAMTPNVKVRVRGATINQHNAAVPYKRGKPETGVARARAEVAADNTPPWADQWNAFEQTWPTKTARFPRANSSSDVWCQAALEAPEALLEAFRNFPFREEVLQLLNAETLTKWMEPRRRECIADGLKELAAISRTQGTKRWLENWSGRWSSAVTEKDIATVVNSKDDWEKLRSLKYGTDGLLHMCDPNFRKMGAIHLLCAEIYAEEERALTGIEVSHDASAPAKGRLHLKVLQKYTDYYTALSGSYQEVSWAQVNDFFANAVAQIEGDDHQSY